MNITSKGHFWEYPTCKRLSGREINNRVNKRIKFEPPFLILFLKRGGNNSVSLAHMKSGCNLNRSVRITTAFSYTKAVFMGYSCHNDRVINRTVFLQKFENCLMKSKIMRDLNRYVRLHLLSFLCHKRLFQHRLVFCSV